VNERTQKSKKNENFQHHLKFWKFYCVAEVINVMHM